MRSTFLIVTALILAACNGPASTPAPQASTDTSHSAPVVAVAPAAPAAGRTPATPSIPAAAPTPPATPVRLAQADLPPITIHLAGDSTVSNYATTTKQEGWGQELAQFFSDKVKINNQAIGGANVQTFKAGNWNKIIAALKPGDFVLMQFGANDSGTAHGPVTPANFAATLEQMSDEVRAKGATPILLTPTIRNIWKTEPGYKPSIERDMGFLDLDLQLAAAEHVPLADMATLEADHLEKIGPERTAPLFPIDHTHTSPEGAALNAGFVAQALREIHSPLANYLKP